MLTLTRLWIAMAALGAGLVHLAVAAGTPPILLVVFLILGLAELAWCVATMVLSRFPLRQVALVGSLLPLVAWASALVLGDAVGATMENLPPLAMASAGVLDLAVGVAMAVSLRRAPDGPPAAAREPGAAWTILGLTAGAVVMTALTLPAIGQTQAGIDAMNGPHGHSRVDVPGIDAHDDGH